MTDSFHTFNDGFPDSGDAAWRKEVEKALKGGEFDTLIKTTLDGVVRGPLFTREDLAGLDSSGQPGHAPFVRGAHAERDQYMPWAIRQSVNAPDPKVSNRQILEELEGGASEIMLRLDPLGETGTAVRTIEELKQVLDGVLLDVAPIHLAPSRMSPQFAALFVGFLEQSGLDLSKLRGGLGLSPIGQKSYAGGGAAELPERLKRTCEVAAYINSSLPNVQTVSITASAPHEAGGSEAQEIAFACAGGASYMRAFIDHGLSPDDAASALEFSFAVDADVHLTIAKLRAARQAWAKVAEAFGVSENQRYMRLHAISSGRMLATQDAYTNLIRNTCAGLGAAAGGADSLTIRPFTEALGGSSAFARRLARNLQVLLMEESHLGRVADPAGGSYLHETLGNRLAMAGWAIFQDIERQGGLFETVKSGWFQTQIAEMRKKRHDLLTSGHEAMIGVTRYPNPDAKEPNLDRHAFTPDQLDGPIIEPQSFAEKVEAAKSGAHVRVLEAPEPEWAPVAPVRTAAPFESETDQA